MTREEKIEMVEQASDFELLEALELEIKHGKPFDKESMENLSIIRAEILERMEAWKK